MIGRQLSDKEFHEQSSASQSSSSTDLDEYQSKLKGELGSLDFQCHSVLPDPSTASEDELVSEHSPCKGEVQVSGGELRVPSLNPENLPEPKQTSKHEELHNTNRTIFPRGCAASTEARGTALKPELDPHELPQLAWQQPASSATACHEQEALRRPSAEQASQQQTGRGKVKQQGTTEELEGTASPSHSLLLKLEVSKSAADSGASLSVLRVGQQVSSASSFQKSMEQLVAEQLLAQSVTLADDLEYSLPTRACQDSSSQQTFQDLASRACRDTSVNTELQESNLVDS